MLTKVVPLQDSLTDFGLINNGSVKERGMLEYLMNCLRVKTNSFPFVR